MKIYIAVIPCDYSSADVAVCYSKEEAEQYIQEHAIRGDTHYCSIIEETVTRVRNPKTTTPHQ